MEDPFHEGGGSELEAELTRLTHENRELRQENARLRARVSLAAATPAATASNAGSEPASSLRSVPAPAAAAPATAPRKAAGHAPASAAGSSNATPAHTPRGAASASAAAKPALTAARIEEAVQRVKRELRAEVETYQKAAELKASQMVQLKQQFELFVTATCEREAAYEVVYTEVFQELEAQRALVRTAQAQLEEQRLEAVAMQKSLQAATKAAAKSATVAAVATTTTRTGTPAAAPEVLAAAPDEGDEDAESEAPPAKKVRTSRAAVRAAAAAAAAAANGLLVDTTRESAEAEAKTQEGAHAAVAGAPASDAPEDEEQGPRRLRIVLGGALLRSNLSAARMKRARGSPAASVASATRATRVKAAAESAVLHMPAAPVFAPAVAASAPASAAAAESRVSADAAASPATAGTATLPTSSPAAATAPTIASAKVSATPDPLHRLWVTLATPTEAAHGFLSLWESLACLRGPDRLMALQTLIRLLLHFLGPADTAADAAAPSAWLPAPLAAAAFVTQPTFLTVVAIGVRLFAVQAESDALQQRGAALNRTDAVATQCRVLLSSLFYRLCVAALRRWQTAAEAGADALEQWATAVTHLYGFQPALAKLAQYTNATAAFERVCLGRGWATYTAQAIFAECFTASTTAASAPSGDAAVARWRELCDSVGWSARALPLERLETAAARCVAKTRVGRGPFTSACAEEALLCLRLVVLYRGFDHMEHVAKLLEQPGVLPMALTQEVYAQLVSLAVMDRVPFRSAGALQHALRLLREYVQEVAPEHCTSAEHFVCVPRPSHLLAALALLRAEEQTSAKEAETEAETARALHRAVLDGRAAVVRWLQAQRAALEMARHSPSLGRDRQLLLRDTELGQRLLKEAGTSASSA